MNNSVVITGRGVIFDIKKDNKKMDTVLSDKLICCLKHLIGGGAFKLSPEIKKQYLGISQYAGIGIQAGRIAWEESQYNKIDPSKWGIMVGTTFGDAPSLFKLQCDVFIDQGPQWMMPNLMINKGPKTVADILAIEKQIKGNNITFTSGRNASGMATLAGYDEIIHANLDGCLLVGAEYIDNITNDIAPTCLHTNSDCLISGAGAIVLKREPVNDNVYGRILYVNAERVRNFKLENVLHKTIKNAMLLEDDINLVLLNQLNQELIDSCIQKSIRNVLTKGKQKIKIITTTEILGDFVGANSIMMIILSTLLFEIKTSPKYIAHNVNNILLVTYDEHGNIWTAIVSK
jgi:3-oxoacyl-(acyl-carrier-protein) synthase